MPVDRTTSLDHLEYVSTCAFRVTASSESHLALPCSDYSPVVSKNSFSIGPKVAFIDIGS
jgi:hypothetical protein